MNICIEDNCENPVKARGLCNKHYQRWYIGASERPEYPKVCIVEVCDRPYLAKGYCGAHYTRMRLGIDMNTPIKENTPGCTHGDCDRKHYAKGYCKMHWTRWREGRNLDGIDPNRECAFEGCEKVHFAHDLCMGHYAQERKGQELRPLRPIRRVVDGHRQCSECEEILPVSEFYKRASGGRTEVFSKCKTCTKALQYMRKWKSGKGEFPVEYVDHLRQIGRGGELDEDVLEMSH